MSKRSFTGEQDLSTHADLYAKFRSCISSRYLIIVESSIQLGSGMNIFLTLSPRRAAVGGRSSCSLKPGLLFHAPAIVPLSSAIVSGSVPVVPFAHGYKDSPEAPTR